MRMLAHVLAVATFCASIANAKEKIREVFVSQTQVADVSTRLGFATLIEFEEKPTSIVLGDQESFRVEYLDQAIAIKPLKAGAKSNIYVFGDTDRYSIRLTENRSGVDADYVVKIRSKAPETSRVDRGLSKTKWKTLEKSTTIGSLTFRLRRVGFQANELVLIECDVFASKKQSIDPGIFWLSQSGVHIPVNRLFLSSLEVSTHSQTKAIVEVNRSDLMRGVALNLELRSKGVKRKIPISAEVLWK